VLLAALPGIIENRFGHAGFNQARTDGIYANIVCPQIAGSRLGKINYETTLEIKTHLFYNHIISEKMEGTMLSVKGIYENGQVRLLEPIPSEKRVKVIVTVLEELDREEAESKEVDVNLFDDLVGVINVREEGSTAHDKYIAS
jgi:hypothetical protein